MKIGVMLPVGGNDGPGGGTPAWADVREMAVAAEQSGLDSVWIADHFLYRGPDGTVVGMHEAWTLLSAVAAVTERVEIAPLVACASFRDPGLMAKMAATLDVVSGGRLILGVGAGWHDPEYEAFGLPTDHRVGRFEEWVEIVARLVRGETVTFDGEYYRVKEAALVPAPERRIPLLVASFGPRMLGLTAKWADQWNTAWYGAVDEKVEERIAAMRAAVSAAGRPADAVELTVGITVAEPDTATGSVEELAQTIKGYEALGVTHLIAGIEPRPTLTAITHLAKAKALAST